jgi:radical SAM superfamily enzyme YgiQ (UPF0313 family)
MIDAVLVHPWTGGKGRFPPLGLLCLAAYAEREGFEVEVCDAAALELTDVEVVERLRRLRPRCVGLGFMSSQWSFAQSLGTAIRCALPDAVLVAGGIHPSIAPESTLRGIPALDAVVVGEGELTFAELLAALGRGERERLAEIPGLAILERGALVRAPPRPLVRDLGTLPIPAWHKVPLSPYTVPAADYRPGRGAAMLVYGSRGCPHRCIFCCVDGVFGPGHRRRPAAQLAEEIRWLAAERGIRELMFVDDVLFQDRRHVLALAREIEALRLGVRWAGNARVDSRALDPETLDACAAAGCVRIDLGVESGSQRQLDESGKGIAVSQAIEAHRRVHARGLATTTFMMVGHPSESLEEVRDSIRLLARIQSEHPQVGTETPFPGTALHALAAQRGWLGSPDPSDYVTHALLPVWRTERFTPPELARMTFLLRRTGELFGALASSREAMRAASRPLLAWRLARLVADRFRAPYQHDLTLQARARAAEAFLALDTDPARAEALVSAMGPHDLERLPLPSARSVDDLVGSLAPGTRALVAPAGGVGAALPLVRRLCRSDAVVEVGVVADGPARAALELPDVAHPKLRAVPARGSETAGAVRACAAGWDVVLVPSPSFSAAHYLRLVLSLLLAPAPRPVHVVALGSGGNVLRVGWRTLGAELARRATARAQALAVDPVRSLRVGWALAALARRWARAPHLSPGADQPRPDAAPARRSLTTRS